MPTNLRGESCYEGYSVQARSLMYLAICTRPDLAIGVSTFIRLCQDPGMVHWEATKRLLRYVKGSAGDILLFCKGEDVIQRPRGGDLGLL